MKNFGLKFGEKDEGAYELGGFNSLPKVVLNESGDWTPYLPKYEPQFGGGWDTFGCTVWGTQNAVEILLKKITGIEYNFSERFTYILAGIKPPGADPHHTIETIRKNGMIDDGYLPMTQTLAEFVQPDPMSANLLNKGLEFKYELKHEYLWSGGLNKEDRINKIRECLKYSPLGVSVTAWYREGDVYVDNGLANNHWCVLFGEAPNGWKIFDSYDQSVKTISFDHKIQVCKRFYLVPATYQTQLSLMEKILKAIQEFLGLYRKNLNYEPPAPETPSPQVADAIPPVVKTIAGVTYKDSYVWCGGSLEKRKEMYKMASQVCDEEKLTPVMKQDLLLTIFGESGFNPECVNPTSFDYGLCQFSKRYYLKEYKMSPQEALDNPRKCCIIMARNFKAGRQSNWIAYTNRFQHLNNMKKIT